MACPYALLDSIYEGENHTQATASDKLQKSSLGVERRSGHWTIRKNSLLNWG